MPLRKFADGHEGAVLPPQWLFVVEVGLLLLLSRWECHQFWHPLERMYFGIAEAVDRSFSPDIDQPSIFRVLVSVWKDHGLVFLTMVERVVTTHI